MSDTPSPSTRRYYIDWLRVLAILTVFIFHTTRFFDLADWHVKNGATYAVVAIWTTFMSIWGMPLMFVVSGASVFYAIGKYAPGVFVRERVLRLLIPLGAALLTHIALQSYLEAVTHARFSGSLWDFLPRYYLEEIPGNYGWIGFHLWYLWLLLGYSLVFLPLLAWLRRGSGQGVLRRLGDFLARPGAVYLLALPVIASLVLIDPHRWWSEPKYSGGSIVSLALFFLVGFVIIAHDGVQAGIERLRWVSLISGVLVTVPGLALYATQGAPTFGTAYYTLLMTLASLCAWLFVLAVWGFVMRHLQRGTPFLAYANEAVLPFFILHQTVILSVGWFVVRWPLPDLLKWAIIVVASLAIIMGLYEYLIRRYNILRILFGMKPRPPGPRPVMQSQQA